jgi:hypothetical protein
MFTGTRAPFAFENLGYELLVIGCLPSSPIFSFGRGRSNIQKRLAFGPRSWSTANHVAKKLARRQELATLDAARRLPFLCIGNLLIK